MTDIEYHLHQAAPQLVVQPLADQFMQQGLPRPYGGILQERHIVGVEDIIAEAPDNDRRRGAEAPGAGAPPFYSRPAMAHGLTPWDYQLATGEWMKSREVTTGVASDKPDSDPKKKLPQYGIRGGVIKHDMGLGKTLTLIHHSVTQQQENREEFPTMFVASKTVMREWKEQGFKKFYLGAKVLYYHKDYIIKSAFDKMSIDTMRSYNFVMTTYDVIMNFYRKLDMAKYVCVMGDEFTTLDGKVIEVITRARPEYDPSHQGGAALYNMPWERIILDESQRIANYTSTTYRSIMALYGKWKWCLTGTPIRSYETDLWAQFRFCGFKSISVARRWKGKKSHVLYNLSRFISVKDYSDVGVVIPDRCDNIYEVNMGESQMKLYGAYLQKIKDMFADLAAGTTSLMAILAVFTRLRQVCIAPYVIVRPKQRKNGQVDVDGDDLLQFAYALGTEAGDWIRNAVGDAGYESPKVSKIVEIIDGTPADEKVIVFSMFTRCLYTIEDALLHKYPQMGVELIDGSITGENRHLALERFKSDPTIKVILIQTKCGGEGLNITVASHIVMIEPWWTHAVHNQAIARAWRRGQEKEVQVHWVITKGSIEEEILKMCDNKYGMSNDFIYNQPYTKKMVSLSAYNMERMVTKALVALKVPSRSMELPDVCGGKDTLGWYPPAKPVMRECVDDDENLDGVEETPA